VTIKPKDGAVVHSVMDDETILSKVGEYGKAGEEYAAKGGMNARHELRHAGEALKLSLMNKMRQGRQDDRPSNNPNLSWTSCRGTFSS
jgi:hypothetical protein